MAILSPRLGPRQGPSLKWLHDGLLREGRRGAGSAGRARVSSRRFGRGLADYVPISAASPSSAASTSPASPDTWPDASSILFLPDAWQRRTVGRRSLQVVLKVFALL